MQASYGIDPQIFETAADVEELAPPKEEVQSVRFDGSTAYMQEDLKAEKVF